MSIFKKGTLEMEDNKFNAPWVFTDLNLLGMYETNPKLVARFGPEWKFMKRASSYKILAGSTYAWCALLVNALLRKVGVKGTDDPAAASFSKFGRPCPFWFGSILPIRHRSGGRHVCLFLYWIDEGKKIAATLDGNRGNRFCVASTDLSGKNDSLVPSPRWPDNREDGVSPSMQEVLSIYPNLKVTSTSSGTR